MKKTISLLAWISVVVTIVALLFIALTKYVLGYMDFTRYYTLEWCIFFMMIIWAFKLYCIETGKRRVVHSIICILFALGAIYFRLMKVF